MNFKEILKHWYFQLFAPKQFNEFYQKIQKSHAYEKMLTEVNHLPFSGYNMLDAKQFRHLYNLIIRKRPNRCLDLACGNAQMANYLSIKYQLQFDLVDFISCPEVVKTNNYLTYYQSSIESYPIDKKDYNLICSVDGLYMLQNPLKIIKKYYNSLAANGSLAIIQNFIPNKLWLIDELISQYPNVSCIDLTSQYWLFWKSFLDQAEKYKEDFIKEGSLELLESRMNEANHCLNQRETRRYFVLIDKGNR